MQVKEKVQGKKRGKPGFVDKRFYVPSEIDAKVDLHRKKLCVKTNNNDLGWDAAAIDLLEKATKHIELPKS